MHQHTCHGLFRVARLSLVTISQQGILGVSASGVQERTRSGMYVANQRSDTIATISSRPVSTENEIEITFMNHIDNYFLPNFPVTIYYLFMKISSLRCNKCIGGPLGHVVKSADVSLPHLIIRSSHCCVWCGFEPHTGHV